MRSLRWSMVAGVVLAFQLLLASAASACIIDSFGASPISVSSDGTIPPGGTVRYDMRVVITPDSPGDSRFEVEVGGVVVASGMATPSANGGEWTYAATFSMPQLGPGKLTIRPQLRLLDTAGLKPAATPLQYNGTPAASTPEPPDSSGSPSPPQQPPGETEEPDKPPNANQPPRETEQPRPANQPNTVSHRGRAAPHREPRAASVPAPRTVPKVLPVPILREASVPARLRSRPKARPVSRMRIAPTAHQALRTPPGDDTNVAPLRLLPAPVAAGHHGPDASGLVLLLALLAGGGGLAIALRRRGAPETPLVPAVAIDLRAAEIEAELQEIVSEGRLELERAQRHDHAPL